MQFLRQAVTGALFATLPILAAATPPKKPAATSASEAPVAASAVDPDVMAAMERSRAFLRTIKTFEMRAEMTIDDVEDDDLKLELLSRARYDFQAPNRLFIEWNSDRVNRQLYFDGTTATLIAPRMGYYASVRQPGTVADMLTHAATDYGIIFPLPDIFLWAVRGAQPVGVQRAINVGYARIAGVDTDHYVFRQPDIDWQVWIQRGDTPLPRKIVITTRDDPAKPKFSALLQWNLNPTFAADQFIFTPPPGTASIGLTKVTSAGAGK